VIIIMVVAGGLNSRIASAWAEQGAVTEGSPRDRATVDAAPSVGDCSRPLLRVPVEGQTIGLDPRFARALQLGTQGLVEASDRLLAELLCAWPDSVSKTAIMRLLARNRARVGDIEAAAVWIERALEAGALARAGAAPNVWDLQAAASWHLRLGDRARGEKEMAALEQLGLGPTRNEEAAFFATRLRIETGGVVEARRALQRWEARGAADGSAPRVVDPSGEARRLAGLSLVLARAGLAAEAEELASRVVQVPRVSSVGWLHARAVAFRALGVLSVDRGEGTAAVMYLAESERSLAEARDIQRARLEELEQEPGPRMFKELGRALETAVPYSDEAELATLEGRAHAAAGELGQAAERYGHAIETIESLRQFLDFGDRLRFFEGRTGPYKGMVGTLLALEGSVGGRELHLSGARGANVKEMAFFFAEAARARTFGELLAQAQAAEAEVGLPPELARQEEQLRASVASDLLRGVPYRESEAYRRLRALVEQLRRTHEPYAALRYPEPVIPSEIPLRSGETLLTFTVMKEQVVTWLLQAGRPLHVYRSPLSTDQLRKAIGTLRASLIAAPAGRPPEFARGASELLYQALLSEPLKMVPRGSSLLIVPDGFLATVPFEVFSARSASGRSEYAGDQVRITYYPSATVLSYERRFGKGRTSDDAKGAGRLLLLADPIYEIHDGRAASLGVLKRVETHISREVALHAFAASFEGVGLRRLPWTAREARLASAALGGRSDLKVGAAANEHIVKTLDLRRYRYLHFATHGVLAGDIPYLRQPALVLTLVGDLQGEDGFLTMNEVAGLKLRAAVSILSACETGLGEEVSGEGVVGFVRAFMLAGSHAVIASLWKIDDAAAAELMGHFYQHLAKRERPDIALRAARQELRSEASGRWSHPFYWAAFVEYGSP